MSNVQWGSVAEWAGAIGVVVAFVWTALSARGDRRDTKAALEIATRAAAAAEQSAIAADSSSKASRDSAAALNEVAAALTRRAHDWSLRPSGRAMTLSGPASYFLRNGSDFDAYRVELTGFGCRVSNIVDGFVDVIRAKSEITVDIQFEPGSYEPTLSVSWSWTEDGPREPAWTKVVI